MKMCFECENAPAVAWFYIFCCPMDSGTITDPLCQACADSIAEYHEIERRAKVSTR